MHVFAYGSLVAVASRPGVLRGYRRVWGVAMDNREVIPGYKRYVDAAGRAPAVDIAFLDLEPTAGGAVNGGLLAVDERELAALDARERQYRRVDVTAEVLPALGATIWAYVGRAEARARLHTGTPVVQRAYREAVDAAFAARGTAEHAAYRASTQPAPWPELDLARVDLPS